MGARLVGPDGSGAGELEAAAGGAVRALRDAGMDAGDRVLLRADNSPAYAAAVLALMHLDVSLVLLDHRHTAADARATARAAGVSWVVSDRADTPFPGRVVPLRALAGPTPDPGFAVDPRPWRERPDALITWSSGTTGTPKGIVRSGEAFLGNLERTQRRFGYRPDDVLMPLLPFSHQWGLSLILLTWISGASLVVAPYTRVDRALRLAGRARATIVDAAPATYHSLLNILDRRPALHDEVTTVRRWCTGGAPMSPGLAQRFQQVMGRPLLDGYGSTEAGNITFALPPDPVACGRPLDGVEVRITAPDGRRAAPGTPGEIWVRSPDLFTAHLSADGIAPVDHRAGYRTGDLGFQDADGNLHVLGRKSAVHRSGHTLYPEAIERTAERCGRPVKIVALDDDRRGAQLVFVVADPDGDTPHAWWERLRALLPAYEQPNRVLVVDRLPLNRTGKVDAAELRRTVLSEFGGGPASAEAVAGDPVRRT
ncbi:class I adenylate-forming enzyme family protein [Actinomadura algeriensis]|uniref:Acyl-CoA synthetase (AMP-forming)/AMP-acid ligase II n=1 Tax=Actinomadura algeriensis TaxID=1679523 RepID=A0ABR9JIR2_9ACTN|nr:class I adenylate-forming enzyme family protein [Actinomadura algeriensis]MBE1530422.1 acyl-CoA synthetase (AMP-forming)/AMP-acid ligase II [Actinomadura algeriensis]